MKEFDFENRDKRMPYRVPDNFFKEFPERMMKQIAEERRRRQRRWGMAIGTTAIAAMFAGVVFFGRFSSRNTVDEKDYIELATVDSYNIDSYISTLSDEELAEQYNYYASDVTLTFYEDE